MLLFSKLIRNRKKFNLYFDSYLHYWFSYHNGFFGRLIYVGKKILAFNKFIFIKNALKKKENMDPNLVFLVAMLRISPIIFLIPLRLGGKSFGVPLPITFKKKISLAIKWIMAASKNKKRKISVNLLANYLLLSIYNKGPVINKKQEYYKTGSSNRNLLKFFRKR